MGPTNKSGDLKKKDKGMKRLTISPLHRKGLGGSLRKSNNWIGKSSAYQRRWGAWIAEMAVGAWISNLCKLLIKGSFL